jgi:uncharacterized protein (TIGR02145 family)
MFNVSWDRDAMPVALWSDTVWVFVDYNNAGVMKRLPLLSGATLTATSAPGVGKVIEVENNNQGVWVTGNARSASSFSATVQLLTATADLAGACAYASNYPPVGEYSSSDATEISFTGTPMYEISLAKSGGEVATVKSGDTFLLPCDYTLMSFTDATGAPGKLGCIPMTGNIDFSVPASVSKNMQASFVVSSEPNTPNPALITYSWSAPYFSPATYEGTTFTSTTPGMPDTYSITLTAHTEDYCDLVKTKDVDVLDCTAPGSTVNFTAFAPCSNATTGDYWYLTDTRESNNVQTYKVKLMADGRIWMVQDLKFGDKCNKIDFNGASTATGKVTSLSDENYYGDCVNLRYDASHTNRGYFYNWPAAMNNPTANTGGAFSGCIGTTSAASACHGICPTSWHIPTGNTDGEIAALHNALNCQTTDCLAYSEAFEGDRYGFAWANGTPAYTSWMYFWGSGRATTNLVYTYVQNRLFNDPTAEPGLGLAIRCIMNY